MVRPVDADSAQTLEQIRAAAIRILDDQGPAGLSFRKVAQDAGVSVGTVRHYYASKDALLEGCLDEFQDQLVELEAAWVEAFLTADNPRDTVRDTVMASCALVGARPEAIRLRLTASVQSGGLSPERRFARRDPFFATASAALAKRTGRPPAELRLVVDSVMRLVAWYGACSDDEVCNVTGAAEVADARAALAKHCAEVAVQLVFVGSKEPSS